MLKRFSRLLIVDDSQPMRSIMSGMLSGFEFENLHFASNGLEALDKLALDKFELIISDWYMEPMNGIDLFHAIRRDGGPNFRTPFLMMTTHHAKFASVPRENGLINFLAKPFTAEALLEKIATLCEEHN